LIYEGTCGLSCRLKKSRSKRGGSKRGREERGENGRVYKGGGDGQTKVRHKGKRGT